MWASGSWRTRPTRRRCGALRVRGVPVRVLMDDRANATYPLNPSRLNEIRTTCRTTDGKCIPMRRRLTSYILHWKMMLFRGQDMVEFSGANYSADAWRPSQEHRARTRTTSTRRSTSRAIRPSSTASRPSSTITGRTRPNGRTTPTSSTRWFASTRSTPRIRRSTSRRTRTTDRGRRPALQRRAAASTSSCTASRTGPHRRDPHCGRARHPRAADHRAGAVPRRHAHVACVERRPSLHGRRPGEDAGPRRTESPEVGDPPRSGRDHRRRSDDGHLRVVELDEPIGHRPGRTQHLHAGSRTSSTGSTTSSSASGTTPVASSRTGTSRRCLPTRQPRRRRPTAPRDWRPRWR